MLLHVSDEKKTNLNQSLIKKQSTMKITKT